MNDFDYDAYQKKRVAASARRRKSGSRSRYVGLPSDHLTQKELRAMSGEVQSYNMNAPIRWSAFLTWPHDLQQEYVSKLQAEYGATGEMLAECFGTSRAIVIRGLKEAGIQLVSQPKHRSKRDVVDRTQRWHGFLYGDHGAPCEETPETEEPLGGASTGIEEHPPAPSAPSLLPLTEVSYTLEGIDAESLAALLSALPLPQSPFTVKLTVTADPMQAGMKVG